jgi:4-amino-4-deoxy-L-arabinose transferase-like glycosyltransferase
MPETKSFSFPRLSPRDRQVFGLLALLTLFGLALRLWGITWGLPDARHPISTYHPDELVNLNAANQADLLIGKFDIGFYNYGTLYFYLVHIAHLFGRGFSFIPTIPPTDPAVGITLTEQLPRMAPEQLGLFLFGRLVTALLGTATIPVVFALGARLFGKRVGLLAACFYAVAPLAVVHAHFLTVDVPATFFAALTLLWAARLLPSPTRNDSILAGIWAGFAAATKYNVGLVLVAPLVALFLSKSDSIAKQRPVYLGTLCGATLVAFLAACPGPLIHWEHFWNGIPNYPGSGVRYELFVHSREGHGELFIGTGLGWWYHLRISLFFGLDIFLLLLCLYGLIYAGVRRSRQDALLLAFVLLYYALAGLSAVRFARYMIPLFPALCVLAARAACAPALWSSRRSMTAFGGVAAAYTAFVSLSYVYTMSQPDPRTQAAIYLEQNAAQGATVAFAKTPWFFSPPLSPRFGMLAAPQRAQAAQETMRYQLLIPTAEWDTGILSLAPDYVALSNLETMHAVDRLKIPPAVQFVEKLAAGYRPIEFAPKTVFSIAASSRLIPEDLLYILPKVTVYAKGR